MAQATTQTAAPAVTVTLTLTKETKGTFRYDSADPDAPVRNIYVKKDALNGTALPMITVTIS